MLTIAESFIEKAATKNSTSGKPYEVKCQMQAIVLSSVWFSAELKEYQKSKSY